MTREGDITVTAAEAAAQVGVARATIDTWVHRGHLKPVNPKVRPRKYWLADVFEAERTRNDALRRNKC